jgi:Carboxypeptidase regulatory-like domain
MVCCASGSRRVAGAVALALLLAGPLAAQQLRGRIVDAHTGAGINAALAELRDSAGRSLGITLASPSGGFVLTAPVPGWYFLRVAAIGYARRPLQPVQVPVGGVTVAPVALEPTVLRLRDLLAIAHNTYCGKRSLSDEVFGRLLESARNALDIIDATIASHQYVFLTRMIHSRTTFGLALDTQRADTTWELLTQWPVESIDPDTLRAVGFERSVVRDGARFVEFYGPDPRVLFSGWFLDDHCFKLGKVSRGGQDTLRITFTPARKAKRVDISGELVLDAHNLALLALQYTHENLPKWMKKHSAGGTMTFLPQASGLWITTRWALWGPIEGDSWFDPSHPQMAGMSERSGQVIRVMPADSVPADTVTHADRAGGGPSRQSPSPSWRSGAR